jgi:hypothetical protein
MIFFVLSSFINLLFFKVFSKYKFSDLSFLFFIFIFINIFLLLISIFFVLVIFIKLVEFVKIIEGFLNFIILNFRNWFLSHFFLFFLDFLFFIHKIRFIFFSGTSYYDPLTKIFLDKFSILKGELLMDFYNFSNKFVFENDFNIPISIFSSTPVFEPSRNFYLTKTYFNLQNEMMQMQNRSRSFFYFSFKKKMFENSREVVYKSFSLFSIFQSFLNFSNKIFLAVLVFLFNFCSLDFFVFLNRISIRLLNNNRFSFFRLLFLKYFTYLRSIFLFLLINLEHDSFLNYLYLTLYRLSLQNFYTRADWNNMFNAYNLNFTGSHPFNGFNKDDVSSILKITLFYFFLYFNYILFFIISIFGLIFKFLFFFIFYLLNFFGIYLNVHLFFLNLFSIFSFFHFSFFVKIFHFLRDLFFFSFLKRALHLFTTFYLTIESFPYLSYLFFLGYTFCISIFFYFQLFYSIFLFFFNKFFSFIYLIFYNIFSLKLLKYFYSFFVLPNKLFFDNLVILLNYLKFNSFFLFSNFPFFLNQNILLFEYFKLNYFLHYYAPNHKFFFTYFKFSNFFKLIVFFRLFRLSFFSFLVLFNAPLDGLLKRATYTYPEEKAFFNKYIFHIANKSIFFFDYLIDLFAFYIFYPFFILFNCFNTFPFKKFFFVFINLFCEIAFLFKSFLWLFVLWLCYLAYYFQFLFFISFIAYFCYFFYYFVFVTLLILIFIFLLCFLFYFFYRFFSIMKFYCFSNKYFVYLFLFLHINAYYLYYYSNLVYFLRVRNFGFLEILGIFFLIRNDLKKYEALHTSLAYLNFNSLNTDLLVNNFLNQFLKKNSVYSNNTFSPVSFFSFAKFKSIFYKQYASLNKFKYSNLRNKFLKIQIRNDLLPEFEYHKYLRSRNSRNLSVFRLRKTLDPHDLYFDSTLDKLEHFNSNSKINTFLSFDFLKVFYNDDTMFNKELMFFRNVFSRKNLSFFYDDLDSLSNFRILYKKVSPVFRYFYLKREKMKYIFSMYTFGNINYFSFSILFNWLLTYRILRTTKNLFFSFNNSFLVFRNRISPKFSLISLSTVLDYIIITFNACLNGAVYLLIFLFFSFCFSIFPISWFLFIFFLFKFVFFYRLLSKMNFYIKYTEKRAQFFSFLSTFFNIFWFVNFHKNFFKRFTFSFRYFLNLSLFMFFLLLFILYLFYFDFSILIFFFCSKFNCFYDLHDGFLVLYCLNSNQVELLCAVFLHLNDLYLFFLTVMVFFSSLRFFFFFNSNLSAKIFYFDSVLLVRFILFLIKIDKKFNLFYFGSFLSFNKISPYILIEELDFLIRLKKIDNERIKAVLKKLR